MHKYLFIDQSKSTGHVATEDLTDTPNFYSTTSVADGETTPLLELTTVEIPEVTSSCFIQTLVGNDTRKSYRVYIYDEISEIYNYTPLLALLQAADESTDIEIMISSPGGCVSTGSSIVAAIHRSRATVTTVALDMVASMASSIWAAGDNLVVDTDASIMYHMASGAYFGNISKSQRSAAALTDYVVNCMLKEPRDKGLITDEEFALITEHGRDVFIPAKVMSTRGKVTLLKTKQIEVHDGL